MLKKNIDLDELIKLFKQGYKISLAVKKDHRVQLTDIFGVANIEKGEIGQLLSINKYPATKEGDEDDEEYYEMEIKWANDDNKIAKYDDLSYLVDSDTFDGDWDEFLEIENIIPPENPKQLKLKLF